MESSNNVVIAKDIISRVLWEVDDEFLDIVTKPEIVKALDYVYHDFCDKTRILAKNIGFLATGTNEYDLYGSTDEGVLFGDDVRQFYRVEVSNGRALESSFEDIMNARIYNNLSYSNDTTIYYAIKHFGKHLRIYFPYNIPEDTEVILWYYAIPVIGTISTLESEFEIDDRYVSCLINGLKVKTYRRIIHRMFRTENFNKFTNEMRQLYNSFYMEAKQEWETEMKRIEAESQAYKEQITPTIVQNNSPMDLTFNDSSTLIESWWDNP